MKTLRFLFLFLAWNASAATTFTEWYVNNAAGNNLNSGSTTNAASAYTSTNANWDGTSVYTPVDGSTPESTVNVGDWASVYLDAATVAVYVAQVTTVAAGVNGAITLSTAAKGGTAPTSGATGRSIKVGGAWSGPSGAVTHPFGFVAATMTNVNSGITQGFVPRVNIRGGTTYSITASLVHLPAGPIRFQGYTTTLGDQGKATIDGGTTGTSYVLLSITGANIDVSDLILANNGATGSQPGLSTTGIESVLTRVVVHNVRGSGFSLSGIAFVNECEAYLCNANAATAAGFALTSSSTLVRCLSHDNAGANTAGFSSTLFATFIKCISDSNGGFGMLFTGTTEFYVYGCDFYNNGSSGIDLQGGSATLCAIQNCNFVKNGGWGINSSGSPIRNGNIVNCGFGTGTQVNTSGAIAPVGGMNEVGTVTYAADVTPWVDPSNGDFRINLAAAKGAGRGSFTETQASYTGTIGYPDIGAAQHLDAGGATEHSFPFVK